LRLDMYVRVVSTPRGPIINGSAHVVAFSGLQIGEATIISISPTTDLPVTSLWLSINPGLRSRLRSTLI
jgi:hypothetical protein